MYKQIILFQNIPEAADTAESSGRNINANNLISKCNFYFCPPGKMELDRMLVLRTRKF